MKDSDDDFTQDIKQIHYSLRLSNDLHKKMDKHLKKLKFLEYQTVSKQKWIIDAIKERLAEEKDLVPEQLPKNKYVNVRIDERLYAKIDEQVDKMKIVRGNYSKKQWITEALYSKLSREIEEQ